MDGLIAGRMVHYIVPCSEKEPGQHRAAVVTKVWGNTGGTVNLYVFPDASYPLVNVTPTSVMFDASGQNQGQWHWIEKA